MEIPAVDALSSSQLLVVGALALFATIIFSSIYIRIRGQYRGRNKLPNHTPKKRVFGVLRKRDSQLPSMPPENHEVVTGARPKVPGKDESEGFKFDFDSPERLSGPIEYVAPKRRDDDRWEVPAEVGDGAFAEATGNGSNEYEYGEGFEVESVSVPDISDEHFSEVHANGGDEDAEYSDLDHEYVNGWETNGDDAFSSMEIDESTTHVEFSDDDGNSQIVEEEYREDLEYEFTDEAMASSAEEDYVPANDFRVEEDLVAANSEDRDLDESTEPESDDIVVPFDNRTVEAKRVEVEPQDPNRSFSVVSVCLISDDDGQIFRDIRGEVLAAFLNNRGFIYLDEEYHLQHKSTVDKGAIRVRNYEATSIGTLVKENQETCGFRLYFRPVDCADPLAKLNEMLKIANLAISFFSTVSAKPLLIYDGRKDNTGSISPLTQEDYDALKRDILAAFPRSLNTASKRTALSRNEYAPSEELPSRAEQY